MSLQGDCVSVFGFCLFKVVFDVSDFVLLFNLVIHSVCVFLKLSFLKVVFIFVWR